MTDTTIEKLRTGLDEARAASNELANWLRIKEPALLLSEYGLVFAVSTLIQVLLAKAEIDLYQVSQVAT